MLQWLKQNRYLLAIILLLLPLATVFAATTSASTPSIPVLLAKQTNGTTSYSLSIQILALATLLSVLPAILMTTTAFTRIIIVLAIARQAIGVPNVPGNQIIIGLALIMTLVVMTPFVEKINDTSIQPYLQGKIKEQQALGNATDLFKAFMLKQTRKSDLKLFADLAKLKLANTANPPLVILMPAFITSELKTAFEIGFLIFLPFLIIDLVVASVLMSMGMMMLSPMVISLPFKILFFVLVDGWSLLVTSLITSFRI